MKGMLVPLCQRYGTVLRTGLGELSITAITALIERVRDLSKPTRILYVSDFDPAGQSMPVAVARKSEAAHHKLGELASGLDVPCCFSNKAGGTCFKRAV
jgi:hypothetical protein